MKIASIGSGLIGASWAAIFATKVEIVHLYDVDPAALERGMGFVRRALEDLEQAGLIDSAAAVAMRVHPVTDLRAALSEVAYVQESVSERLAVKRELFVEMDRLAPASAILASSTSELPPSSFLLDLPGSARCMVVHPLNPPHIIPAVEICGSPATSLEARTRATSILESVGRHVVMLNTETRGFVMNRLQAAVMRECLHLVDKGVCSVRDVETAMKFGLGLRWSAMGPFESNYLASPNGYAHLLEYYAETVRSLTGDLDNGMDFSSDIGVKVDREIAEIHGTFSRMEIEKRRNMMLLRIRESQNT